MRIRIQACDSNFGPGDTDDQQTARALEMIGRAVGMLVDRLRTDKAFRERWSKEIERIPVLRPLVSAAAAEKS